MARRIFCCYLLIVLNILLVGCGQQSLEDDPQYIALLTEVTALREADQAAIPLESNLRAMEETPTSEQILNETPGPSPEIVDWIDSANAIAHLGELATVRVAVSDCAYKPGISGEPTFCNDQPFPNHMFTYLIWGEDWSHYDQACVLVSGEIVEYDGKAQINLENEEQITLCDRP